MKLTLRGKPVLRIVTAFDFDTIDELLELTSEQDAIYLTMSAQEKLDTLMEPLDGANYSIGE